MGHKTGALRFRAGASRRVEQPTLPAAEPVLDLHRLNAITASINAGFSLDEVLDRIYESFKGVIPYNRISLSLIEQDGKTVRACWVRTDRETVRIAEGYAASLEGSSLQQVVDTNRPRIINDLRAYLANKPGSTSTRLIVEEGYRSSLTCPLIANGVPIGFLFFSSVYANSYTEEHVAIFEQIAGQIAVIVEKSRLASELARQKAEVERQAHELAVLNRLLLDSATHLRLDALLEAIARDTLDLVSADVAGVYLHHPGSRTLGLAALTGLEHPGKIAMLRQGEGLAGAAWKQRRALAAQAHPDWETGDTGTSSSAGGYVVCVPLQWGGQFVGVLEVVFTQGGAPSKRDVDRLNRFAGQASVMIHSAQLFAYLEQSNTELEAFSHTVAHDLKAPLSVIVGYTEIILDDGANPLPDDVREYLHTIQAHAFSMSEMINNLLLLARLRKPLDHVEPVDMDAALHSAVERYQDQIDRRGILLEMPDTLPRAVGHRQWAEEIFANLISNAIKYIGKDNRAPHIVIRGVRQGREIRYEIEDNGLGISPDDQIHLFDMFARFHPREARGMGIGLSIVQRMVNTLQGRVGVNSEPGHGSTFWFTLPAAEDAPSA
ncbi:MAG: hypothetical protein Kow00124_18040 [Anaerolineae bacterium]